MAGAGRRTFQPGEVLTASNVMNYLQDQAVMNFAGTAARGSAIGTAVAEGMVSYLADNNFVQAYDGTAWRSLGGVQVASGTATRNALLPSPVQGDSVFRTDVGYIETYFGTYNVSTNPGGATPAGWYPTAGKMPKIVATRNATNWTITGGQYNAISSNTYWTTTVSQGGAGNWSTGITIPFAGVWRVSLHLGALSGGVVTASGWQLNNTTVPGSWVDLYGVCYTTNSALAATSVITRAFNANDVLSFMMYAQSTYTWVGTGGAIMPGQVVLEFVSPAQ